MDDQTEVPVTEDDRKKLQEAQQARQGQAEQVQKDLDASLEGPVSRMPEDEEERRAREDGRPQCDLCGKYAHSFEDCPAAGEVEEELTRAVAADGSYLHQRNRHAALELAIRVVTSPYSPFRTERASADEITEYAEKFQEFLDG